MERQQIIKLFKKHCSECNGLCCCCEFTVFNWELVRMAIGKDKLIFRKQWGKKGKAKDITIERISIGKACPLLRVGKGCTLSDDRRPLDCVSYPVYPILKYSRDGAKEIDGMMVHKSCPLAGQIAQDRQLIKAMKRFWENELREISKKNIKDWFGNKRNYWLDKNIIRTEY